MTEIDEIRVWTHITAQQSLLVEVWANLLSKLPEPYKDLETMERHTEDKVRFISADVDKEYAEKFSIDLKKVYANHWTRVRETLDRICSAE